METKLKTKLNTKLKTKTDFPTPLVMVDIAVFTLLEGELAVVLWKRDREPYIGTLALPGGAVHVDEDADLRAAADRILKLRTGCRVSYLEQLATFSGKERDPRHWSLSVAYFALVPASELEGLAPACSVVPLTRLPLLRFDHEEILRQAVERLRNKATYSQLPAYLLTREFTMAELHEVYQQVLDQRLDAAAFRRKIIDQRIVAAIKGRLRTGSGRPAQLFRLVSDNLKSFGRQTVA